MLTLALDASTASASAALLRDHEVVADTDASDTGSRAERLMPAVEAVLGLAGASISDINRIACGGGPGRFTSLRIAASIAKGIASTLDVPLLTAPSPLLIVAGAAPPLDPGRWLAVLDAMRGDVFAQAVDVESAGSLRVVEGPRLVSRAAAEEWSATGGLRLAGPDESIDAWPHARGFARLLADGLAVRVDLATWEPDYGRKAEAQVRWEAAHGRPLESR